jgi:uncharacterized DUF497 family protein
MEFTWDERKNRRNIEKHGIDFDDAIRIFDGPVLEKESVAQGFGETRNVAIGLVEGRELCVIYTIREEKFRIFSARRARRDERKAYREALLGRRAEGGNGLESRGRDD